MKKGEQVLIQVTVLKIKGDTVTKIQMGGLEYALVHQDHVNGNKSKKKGG